ncbi:putative reverse transcriptase domain-containing protein [Tanacetum coccineum]
MTVNYVPEKLHDTDLEIFLKQKAKIKWLDVGDSNSAYFHKSVKGRNQRSKIEAILNSNNIEVSGPSVPDVFVTHYEAFLGNNVLCEELNVEGLFQSKVTDKSYGDMVQHVSDDEIKAAIFDIGDDRAPGPDGYTSAFFKKGWDIVGPDVCKAIRDFFTNGKLLKEINHTFIALILNPKIIMRSYHRNQSPPEMWLFKVDIQRPYDTEWILPELSWKGRDEFKLSSGLVPSIPKSTVSRIELGIGRTSLYPLREDSNFVGNGEKTSLWYDTWCSHCPLSNFLSHWDIMNEGFNNKTCVAELVSSEGWQWPQTWLLKAPDLGLVPVPNLVADRPDIFRWRNQDGVFSDFSVSNAWEAIRPRGIEVGWSRIVWFSHCIHRHAFHLWLVMRKSLKTKDNIRPWDVGPDVDISRLRCPLCNLHPDSHDHLFFRCSFSLQVWRHVCHLADMDVFPSTAQDIVSHLLPLSNKRTAKSIIGRLFLAASAYFVWFERNNRLFKKIKRPPEEIHDLIMVIVHLKLVSLRFKSKDNNHVEDLHRFWYPYRESQVKVVLFFPSPRVFPLGFPWGGFLRRQSHLDSSPPYTWKVDAAAWKLCKSDWHVS